MPNVPDEWVIAGRFPGAAIDLTQPNIRPGIVIVVTTIELSLTMIQAPAAGLFDGSITVFENSPAAPTVVFQKRFSFPYVLGDTLGVEWSSTLNIPTIAPTPAVTPRNVRIQFSATHPNVEQWCKVSGYAL